MAGYVIASVVPMALALLLLNRAPLSGGREEPRSARRAGIAAAASSRPPEVSISIAIEPAGPLPLPVSVPAAAGASAAQPPVFLPGYLLPDDGREEANHAGG
jgi:hypothetical protein